MKIAGAQMTVRPPALVVYQAPSERRRTRGPRPAGTPEPS